MRTTSSVDIEVCAADVLFQDRDGVEGVVVAQLSALLQGTTAIYLVSQYTTAVTGLICWRFVYQASSPSAAAATETLLAQQPAGDGLLSLPYQGQTVLCTTRVQPWQGETPPLPLWDLTASDLILFGGAVGGGLSLCLIAVCCFVALARSAEDRRAGALLHADNAHMGHLMRRVRRMTRMLARSKPTSSSSTDEEEESSFLKDNNDNNNTPKK